MITAKIRSNGQESTFTLIADVGNEMPELKIGDPCKILIGSNIITLGNIDMIEFDDVCRRKSFERKAPKFSREETLI